MASPHHRSRVVGVDFSGAKDAGKHIWVAEGTVDGSTLRIDNCSPAWERFGVNRGRDDTLPALREFIAGSGDSVFGLDFPFGLPRSLLAGHTWESFTASFSSSYPSPDAFKRACFTASAGKELKRLTDRESRTPFSPFNLRLYKQTYYGIRDVLAPLVQSRRACMLPMQHADGDKPWVLEICPASTLKDRKLSFSYKGSKPDQRISRMRIVEALESVIAVSVRDSVRSRVLDDRGGDALDSVIAACAVFSALPELAKLGNDKPEYSLEGYVYV